MSVAAVASGGTTDERVRRFHDESFVFDGLSIGYVLNEPNTERRLAGGVDDTNVTIAPEEG